MIYKYGAYILACDGNCESCDTNGANKCDAGQCRDPYALDSSNVCRGEYPSYTTIYCILQSVVYYKL